MNPFDIYNSDVLSGFFKTHPLNSERILRKFYSTDWAIVINNNRWTHQRMLMSYQPEALIGSFSLSFKDIPKWLHHPSVQCYDSCIGALKLIPEAPEAQIRAFRKTLKFRLKQGK